MNTTLPDSTQSALDAFRATSDRVCVAVSDAASSLYVALDFGGRPETIALYATATWSEYTQTGYDGWVKTEACDVIMNRPGRSHRKNSPKTLPDAL